MEMETARGAERAVKALDGREMWGRTVGLVGYVRLSHQ